MRAALDNIYCSPEEAARSNPGSIFDSCFSRLRYAALPPYIESEKTETMKTSVVVADGTFETNTAPLLGSFDQVTRQAAELGYDAVSVTVNRPERVELETLQEACRQNHIAVSGLATGRIYTVDGCSLGSSDSEKRQEAVRRMLAHGEFCARLGGAKLIVGAIRGWTKDAGGRKLYEKLFRDSMEQLVSAAEKLNIQIVLEAISHIDSDAYCSVAETAEFIRSFGSSALQLQLDSIHLYNNGEKDFYNEILKAGDLVGQVDISDVDRMAPDGKHFDFPLLIRALKEVGYQDYLVSEFRAQPSVNAAGTALAYLRGLL